jgi:serine/threonine protein kinase/tetratricopeptide (TPR) repeat protein
MSDITAAEVIFFAALDKQAGPKRAAYLEEACGADNELRQQVERLLTAQPQVGSFPNEPALAQAATIDETPLAKRAGTVIGPYKLLQQIGEGGMGIVFLAEQVRPVQRKVALKIIKPGMDSAQVIARFEAERQALAMMDHQNIARVLDAGTTPAEPGGLSRGRPYFVMELVHGVPITQFCDERRLTPRQRLELFVPVCQAIQHAHQKGIIHRDIKPSNVLVTMYDDKPVPKVIDFGVAKAIEQRLTEKTLFTHFGALVGTFEYMSPEQAELNAFGVDTRSDIYSLGVLLYELLTGTTPLERQRLQQAALNEVVRLIKEEESPRPSRRLSSSNNLAKIAAARGTAPTQLSGQVRGDIDWIVMKCLEKDRTRRYETANGLTRDIERHLADEPVEACPPSAGYRLKKYIRRNKGKVVSASLVLLALTGGLGAVLAVQSAANDRLAASLERETLVNEELTRSRAVVQARFDLALEAIKTFHTGDSEELLLKEERFKELRDRRLKSAAGFYRKLAALLGKETDFASRRALAQSNFELAELTRRIGRPEDALAAHQSVLATREALAAEPGADPIIKADVGRSLTEVASLLQATDRPGEALAAYRRAESALAEPGVTDPEARAALADCRTRLALLLFFEDDYVEALAAMKLARADQEPLAAAPGASPKVRRNLAETVNQIGFLLWNMARPAEAEVEFRAALALYSKLAEENQAESEFRRGQGSCHFYIGNTLWNQGKPSEAEAELRLSIALHENALKDNPTVIRNRRSLAVGRFYLGMLLAAVGKLEAALTEYKASIADFKSLIDDNAVVGEFRRIQAEERSRLGILLLQIGRPQDAEAECRLAESLFQLEHAKRTLAIDRLMHVYSLRNLGDVLRSSRRSNEVKGLYEQGIRLAESLTHKNPDNPESWLVLVGCSWRYGLTLCDLGDLAKSAAEVRQAVRLCDNLAEWPECLYEAACCHAALAGLARRPGSGVSAAEGQKEAEEAMKWLGRAVAKGYQNSSQIRMESAFDSVRKRPDFLMLVAQTEPKTPAKNKEMP